MLSFGGLEGARLLWFSRDRKDVGGSEKIVVAVSKLREEESESR